MRSNKKLLVTKIEDRLSLLLSGEVFYTTAGWKIAFDIHQMYSSKSPFTLNMGDGSGELHNLGTSINATWYYPAKTYIIHGVELADNRLALDDIKVGDTVYISDISHNSFYYWLEVSRDTDELFTECERNLIHSTKESAIAHTKALLGEIK